MKIAKISNILLIINIQVCVVIGNSSYADASEYVILPWKITNCQQQLLLYPAKITVSHIRYNFCIFPHQCYITLF